MTKDRQERQPENDLAWNHPVSPCPPAWRKSRSVHCKDISFQYVDKMQFFRPIQSTGCPNLAGYGVADRPLLSQPLHSAATSAKSITQSPFTSPFRSSPFLLKHLSGHNLMLSM